MRLRSFFLATLALSTAFAHGNDNPMSQLFSARSLKCHFDHGTSATWMGSKPKPSPVRAGPELHFDAIDIKYQSARVIGNAGARDVKVFPARAGLSFIEMAPNAVDITTVFSIYGKDHEFIAIDTRHELVSGVAIGTQYYGSCQLVQ